MKRVRTVFARWVTADTSVSGITADILREISPSSPLTPISSEWSREIREILFRGSEKKNRESSRNKVPTRIDTRNLASYRSRREREKERVSNQIFSFSYLPFYLNANDRRVSGLNFYSTSIRSSFDSSFSTRR